MLPSGRISGVLLPLFSFRSKSDFGIGDFGALPAFFRWMTRAKQRLLMLLPLLPTAPGDPSPYSTRSAFGLNPLFIDLAAIPEFQDAGGFGALSAEDKGRLEEARGSPRIRYDLVFALKGAALDRAFARFEELHVRARDRRAQAFEDYRAEQAHWLDSFCLFTALSQHQQQRPWWEWPAQVRDRQPQALEAQKKALEREVRFQAWLQWVAEVQWQKVREEAQRCGILLCGDEPFIIGQDSADAWANPHILRRDARLGVPPDDFSATGQDWGLPYFDFEQMERDDYGWLRSRAKKAASYYDLRRVDHAVGYFRQWIRDEQTPAGRFIPPDEPSHRALGEKTFKLLSEGAGIVAEDLGVIPKFVRETLTRLGIPGYRVLRWERDDGVYRNPHEFPALSLVCTGSHDTEPVREWWETATDDERASIARVYPEFLGVPFAKEFTPAVHQALLAAAEGSGSGICVIPWQDILGTRDRINLPGSMSDANWSYRMAQPVEELLSREETRKGAELIARLTGRGRR